MTRRWLVSVLCPAGLALLAAGAVLPFAGADDPPKEDSAEEESSEEEGVLDPLGANAACYLCHIPFVREGLAKTHLKHKVTCIECHGLSAAHANDEDIGATKPDHPYARKQVDGMCGKCHKEHDASAHDVVARFIDRKLPAKQTPVCTDCHGHHRIEQAAQQ